MEANWIFGIGTIIATVAGPILAVQAQKYLERASASRSQKDWVFSTLMATRGARLAPEHVRALNMIDLAFNGGRSNRRKATETDVLDRWREYLEHLNTQITETNAERWYEKQAELLVLMLSAMATDLNFRFDRVLLRSGMYQPKGHTDLELDQHRLRHYAIKVLSGEQPISMNVTDFPVSEDVMNSQLKLQAGLSEMLSGQGHLNVRVQRAAAKEPTDVPPA
jgi:uncharacterized protein (DUF952 family)